MKRLAPAITVLALMAGYGSLADTLRNASKYGAMFSWWYDSLPPQTKYIPTIDWDARSQKWWNAVIRQASDAGLGWIAAGCWGKDSPADPAMLEPLLRAIDANGGGLKVALFDDTTSEVLRKNRAKGRGWVLSPRFDLADMRGAGEGGLAYFYDEQWQRYFATVPDRYRLKIHGRPVAFMWHGGFEWYSSWNAFGPMLDALRAATARDFGVDPFIIVEESWRRLDPGAAPDAIYDWFDPSRNYGTLASFGGVTIGFVVPGFDCPTCVPPAPVIDRQNGELYRSALDAIAPEADLVLIEGFVNVDENAHLVETFTWGRRYINLTRWYATNVP